MLDKVSNIFVRRGLLGEMNNIECGLGRFERQKSIREDYILGITGNIAPQTAEEDYILTKTGKLGRSEPETPPSLLLFARVLDATGLRFGGNRLGLMGDLPGSLRLSSF